MRRRDEFITVINTFKIVSPTITDEQRIGLPRQIVQCAIAEGNWPSTVLTA